MNYHVGRAGQQLGVHPEENIRAMLGRGELRPDDLGWKEGMTDWRPLGELFPGLQTPPPPLPAPGFTRQSGGYASQGRFGHGGSLTHLPKPSNNLVPAILVTLFCCLPLGIPAIVFASLVDGKYAAGDHAGAENAARKSRLWMWWSLGVGLVVFVLYVGLTVAGGMAGHLR